LHACRRHEEVREPHRTLSAQTQAPVCTLPPLAPPTQYRSSRDSASAAT
jgi:hypothetical protein